MGITISVTAYNRNPYTIKSRSEAATKIAQFCDQIPNHGPPLKPQNSRIRSRNPEAATKTSKIPDQSPTLGSRH